MHAVTVALGLVAAVAVIAGLAGVLASNARARRQGPVCEQCGRPLGATRVETVDGRGSGWKCERCRWWNWLLP